MDLPIRPLGDYWQLLQKHGLLASDKPLPTGLLARPVRLVSCDSQTVTEDTLFIVKGAHFKGQYLSDAIDRGPLSTSPTGSGRRRGTSPASRSAMSAGLWACWPTSTTTTPAEN